MRFLYVAQPCENGHAYINVILGHILYMPIVAQARLCDIRHATGEGGVDREKLKKVPYGSTQSH